MDTPSQRVSPVVFPQTWALPGRPDPGNAAALDAYRQSDFQLKPDLRLLHDGMNLVLRVVRDTYPSRFRTHASAAAQLYWSRTFHYVDAAALLVTRGSYVGVPPLVRTACECHSAAVQLSGEELGEFLAFLSGSLKPNDQFKAIDVGSGTYHAGGTLASDAALGLIYRASTELARPYFGPTLVEVAPESNQQKLAVLFGDNAFHFGWAQLCLGLLIGLCAVILQHAARPDTVLGTTDETRAEIAAYAGRSTQALSAPDRCHVDEIEDDFARRLLISNFRRQSGGAPRRLLL